MKKRIYLDYAAATPLAKEVRRAMEKTEKEIFGNPSAIHDEGRKAKETLENARKRCAKVLQVKPEEILFTGSGTESVNLAIFGAVKKQKTGHIITSEIEHTSVMESCNALKQQGFKITYLPVDKRGIVSVTALEKAITSTTILVSIMYANNEIGSIQPITEIGMLLKKYPTILFHTDACQAAGALSLVTEKLGVHLLSLNGEKIYGPKGTGLLFKKRWVSLMPQLYGGGQEKGLRPGTENVSSIVGLGKALEIADTIRKAETPRLTKIRDNTIKEILKINGADINGHATKRLPNNINVSFKGINGETLVIYLNNAGVAVATGSACTEKSVEPSHVITALGRSRKEALSSIRITLGRYTDENDMRIFLKKLKESINKIRIVT